jgi:hypothetical protein
MPHTEPEETYLGDGLYVSVEHGQIRLRAPRFGRDDVVFLEAETLEAFMIWLRKLRERAQKEGPSAVK